MNITTCTRLGASFLRKKFQPYFYSQSGNDKIRVVLDAPHMVKLARNCLGRKKILYDGNNLKIEWKYFVELERFRSEKGFKLTHKMNKKHIQWQRTQMNVRLAVETLSDSVANSMEFLMNSGHKEFVGCAGTIKFIRYINKIFDILNTKKVNNGNIFKSPINHSNQEQIFSFCEEAIEYLRSLKLTPEAKPLVTTNQRTAFRGFIIDMVNLKSIYQELVELNLIESFHSFRLSQDPLEGMFGRVRSLNGSNDNPTVTQFCSAMRKIAVNAEINCSTFTNCLDSLNILKVSSMRPSDEADDEPSVVATVFSLNDYLELTERTEHIQAIEKCKSIVMTLKDSSVAYIASRIESKIVNSGRFTCGDCLFVFSDNVKTSVETHFGNMSLPCESTFEICTIVNNNLSDIGLKPNFDYNVLLDNILRKINYAEMYTNSNFENHREHKYYFIRFIAEEFIRIQTNDMARRATLNEQELMLRAQLKKFVHYRGL